MNTTVPWSLEGVSDDHREAAVAAARRSGQSLGAWLDGAIAQQASSARGSAAPAEGPSADHAAEMEAIAAELARLSGSDDDDSAVPRRERSHAAAAGPGLRSAIRDAVAEIARRQADLDGRGDLRHDQPRREPVRAPAAAEAAPRAVPADARIQVGPAPEAPAGRPGPAGLRRAGIDLSSEVAETFARFSRDLHAAIQETDARPEVAELGRNVVRIGQAVERLPSADALAQIGEQTREMHDLLKAPQGRPAPLDGVERHVAALEARLGRLAAMPASGPVPPTFGDTMAEVRTLLERLDPSGPMAALEGRLGDLTARIERGMEAGTPTGLIESLGRRVDEIHAALRSQLAESAVDTRPLEGLVRGLSDRISQARAASADFEQLEVAMRDVAARIEAAGADPRGLQALETQFSRLAERLDRSETSLKALDGVEHALGELFSQFEVTRQVAIDAAETAARTAARDTLRAALQNPSLAQRGAEFAPSLADQVTRGLDELRALQDSSDQRTQTTLADIRAAVERLAQAVPASAPAARAALAVDEPRRRRGGREPAVALDPAPPVVDPADLLIEPGFGRGQAHRAEPRLGADAGGDPAPSVAPTAAVMDADGPASFIAAARRAAQAAQASAASTAAQKETERRPAPQAKAAWRSREPGEPAPAGTKVDPLATAKTFLARRRRPLLLGLAAIVLLVGALEVVRLGVAPGEARRVSTSETTSSRPQQTMALDGPSASPAALGSASVASLAAAAPVPAPAPAVAAAPPLPTFIAGATRSPMPADGLPNGLRDLAAAGDAGAQYEVGLRYADGRGVTRDPRQAVAWYGKAAAQGSAPAQYRLGSAYEKGVGADRDPALAMSWYGKAADAGNIRAMHNLAVMAAEGAAGKPDYAKAAQWFGKASAFGVRDSQFNLAILYARGLGIEQSLIQSYKWFAVAAASGDEDSAKKRDEVAAKLDAPALAAAKAAVDAFKAATPASAANEVPVPPGGWDAVSPRPGAPAPSKVSQL